MKDFVDQTIELSGIRVSPRPEPSKRLEQLLARSHLKPHDRTAVVNLLKFQFDIQQQHTEASKTVMNLMRVPVKRARDDDEEYYPSDGDGDGDGDGEEEAVSTHPMKLRKPAYTMTLRNRII